MKTEPNGSTWDDTLRVGDIITAYTKGYHLLVGFEDRSEYKPKAMPPCIISRQLLKDDGTPVKSTREYRCDASYCKRVSGGDAYRMYHADKALAEQKLFNLLELLPKHG